MSVEALDGEVPRLTVNPLAGLKPANRRLPQPAEAVATWAAQDPPASHPGGAIPGRVHPDGTMRTRRYRNRGRGAGLAVPREPVRPIGVDRAQEAAVEDLVPPWGGLGEIACVPPAHEHVVVREQLGASLIA